MRFEPVSLGNGFGIKLDISDLKFQGKSQLEPFLIFNVKTYKVLSSEGNKPDKFKTVCGAGNWFFENCATPEQKKSIAEFFALANQMIRSEMPQVTNSKTQTVEFIAKLGDMYCAIVEECGLMDHFYKYAADRVQLQDITGYGSRPQDSKELTFSIAEMNELMNLAFLIKFIAPIFGELMLNIPDQVDADGNKKVTEPKDIKIVSFLRMIIDRHYRALNDKLAFFIEHIVERQIKDSNTAAAIFAGLIQSTRVEWIRSAILVRNFVCCSLEREDSNIVRFVDTMVHSHLISQSNFANRNQVRSRKPPSSFSSGEDDESTAQMETDSIVSNRPMDTPIIIEGCVDNVIDDFLLRFSITHAEMKECFDFLMSHPIQPTLLNMFMACAIFGDMIGGGRGIESLEREPLTKLICLLQMLAFQHGLFELGHMLTAKKMKTVRLLKGAEEVKFELNYSTSFAYRNCKAKFACSSKVSEGKEWDKQMKDICDEITQSCFVYNTPYAAIEKLGDKFQSVNGDEVPVEVEIINEACTMIDMFKR